MLATQRGVERYRRLCRRAIERRQGANLRPAERLLCTWWELFVQAIEAERLGIQRGESGVNRGVYGPYWTQLDSERTAVVAMHETVSICLRSPNGILLQRISAAIGRAVNAEVNMDRLRREAHDDWAILKRDRRHTQPRFINMIARKRGLESAQWGTPIHIRLGATLIYYLIQIAKVPDRKGKLVPAFKHQIQYGGRLQKYGTVTMSTAAMEIIDRGHSMRETLHPRLMPMVIQPDDWTDIDTGGYLIHNATLIKTVTPLQRKANKRLPAKLLKGVNILGHTKWRVNSKIHKLIRYVWDKGLTLGNIPELKNEELPIKPADIDTNSDARRTWKRSATLVHARNEKVVAKRLELYFKISVADQFLNERFHLPHQIDFRGRAYPMPLFLSHHNDDFARSMLLFDRPGKETDEGKYWLFVHAANQFGMDKISFDDRVTFINDNLEKVCKCADDPVDNRWWVQAENPWQFLAACFEIAQPTGRLPVQMDASCNGLQHYAAMARDEETADLVNLGYSDKPNDLYEAVAKGVIAKINQDVVAGRKEAKILDGKITRKTIKSTVMTSAYGVTRVGARIQMMDTLVDFRDVSSDDLFGAATYLANLTLESIDSVCTRPAALMRWCRRMGKEISKAGHPIAWKSPIGLEVIQPYRNIKVQTVKTVLQNMRVINTTDEATPVSKGKQNQSFSPNWVHSIDASHMFETVIACEEAGITIAAVHDSYWTHPSSVDQMRGILRKTFHQLHSSNQPLQLHTLLTHRLGLSLPEPPKRGNFSIDKVLESLYCFS